jgi:poly(3-hydroxybutyrate) depolymerase
MRRGRGVVLVTIDGGGHQWPPFATQMLWRFFAAHPHLYYVSCAIVEKM